MLTLNLIHGAFNPGLVLAVYYVVDLRAGRMYQKCHDNDCRGNILIDFFDGKPLDRFDRTEIAPCQSHLLALKIYIRTLN
jgi:hypothetical protein